MKNLEDFSKQPSYFMGAFDVDGNLVGWKSDSLDSLSKDWGKLYKKETALSVFDKFCDRISNNQAGMHDKIADTILKYNTAGAALIRNGRTDYSTVAEIRLYRTEDPNNYWWKGFGAEQFKELLKNIILEKTMTKQK